MKSSSFGPLLAVFLLFSVLAAAAQSVSGPADWVLLGPEGGDARSLAYDPHDPNRIFLGTSAGELFLSTDGGAQWSRFAHLGAGNDYVLDNIAVDPTDSKLIYVAAWSVETNSGDLFRSRDGGQSWETLPGMHGKSIRAFTLAPSDNKTLVVGALDGVFRSRDAGQTWQQISPPNHAEIKNIESVAIDPKNPDVVYAGTWHLPWKTDDGGRTWHNIKNGIIDDSDVFSIIIDPTNPQVVYASACSGIYRSENAGALFHKIQGIPATARRTRVLQQDPTNPLVVYAGTTEGLWKTVDAGKTFRRMGPSNLIVNDVMIDPRRPSRVLLATDRSGVLTSNDGAQSLIATNRGFSHRQVSSAIAGRDPQTVYAAVLNDKEFGGVFASRDNGAHWTQMNTGFTGEDVFTLAQADSGELLAGTNRGVFRYDSTAARWEPRNLVLTEKITSTTRLVGKKKKIVTRRDFVKSQLRGPVMQIATAPQQWVAATPSGIYVSLDHGQSWHGGPVIGATRFISVSAAGEQVAAATPSSVLLSTDKGVSWNKAQIPAYITRVYSVVLEPRRVWLNTREGAFFSNDAGATWEHVLVGMPAKQVVSVAYDAHNQRVLAVANNGEVFATPDGGNSWTRTANPGRPLRTVSVANGKLLGITQFNGIIAVNETTAAEPASSTPASTGISQIR